MPERPTRPPEGEPTVDQATKRKERIANREEHEGDLNLIVENLDNSLFWKHAEIVYPDTSTVERLLKKERWPTGAGRYVARADVQHNPGPKKDDSDNSDRFYEGLLAIGYVVDVWPDMSKEDALEYFIYEKLEG
jgi:hypothetical protein